MSVRKDKICFFKNLITMSKVLVKNGLEGKAISGVATVTESFARSVDSSQGILTPGKYYFVPQNAHPEDVEINNEDGSVETRKSARFVCIRLNSAGIADRSLSVSARSIENTYVGVVVEGEAAPKIPCAIAESGRGKGLYRPVSRTRSISVVAEGGPLPVESFEVTLEDGSKAKSVRITEPFILEVVGRKEYYQPNFKQVADGRWDMIVEDDDDHCMVLTPRFDYVYKADRDIAGCDTIEVAKISPEIASYLI